MKAEDELLLKESREGTLTIKLSGPMGIGKTTLAFYIKKCLEAAGAQNITLDIDSPAVRQGEVDIQDFVERKLLRFRPGRKIVIEDRWRPSK